MTQPTVYNFWVRDYGNLALAYNAAVDLSSKLGAGTVYTVRGPSGNLTGFQLKVWTVQ